MVLQALAERAGRRDLPGPLSLPVLHSIPRLRGASLTFKVGSCGAFNKGCHQLTKLGSTCILSLAGTHFVLRPSSFDVPRNMFSHKLQFTTIKSDRHDVVNGLNIQYMDLLAFPTIVGKIQRLIQDT